MNGPDANSQGEARLRLRPRLKGWTFDWKNLRVERPRKYFPIQQRHQKARQAHLVSFKSLRHLSIETNNAPRVRLPGHLPAQRPAIVVISERKKPVRRRVPFERRRKSGPEAWSFVQPFKALPRPGKKIRGLCVLPGAKRIHDFHKVDPAPGTIGVRQRFVIVRQSKFEPALDLPPAFRRAPGLWICRRRLQFNQFFQRRDHSPDYSSSNCCAAESLIFHARNLTIPSLAPALAAAGAAAFEISPPSIVIA